MQGLHLTADLYGCACAPALLTSEPALATLCRSAVAAAGLTIVDEKFFVFPDFSGQPGGVTGAVLLAESHLALHTWPERSAVTLDVYVCNFSTDNSPKAERLLADLSNAFAPQSAQTERLLRGAADTGGNGELLIEQLNDQAIYGYRAQRRIETLQSEYQKIEVFDTVQFGKLFRLDGDFMTSERDEFFYHENIIHPAAIAHPAPRRALILGGGDGGSCEELLKHPSIEQVTIVELDGAVIDMAQRHLGSIHRGALTDTRVTVRIDDGEQFVQRCGDRFDLIVLDLTDPDTPANRLYSAGFFKRLARLLNAGGAVALHVGSPVFQPALFGRLVRDLRAAFKIVRPMTLYVPLYGALWGLAVASDTLDPLSLDPADVARRLRERNIGHLQFYNSDTHRALFALPNFVRALIDP